MNWSVLDRKTSNTRIGEKIRTQDQIPDSKEVENHRVLCHVTICARAFQISASPCNTNPRSRQPTVLFVCFHLYIIDTVKFQKFWNWNRKVSLYVPLHTQSRLYRLTKKWSTACIVHFKMTSRCQSFSKFLFARGRIMNCYNRKMTIESRLIVHCTEITRRLRIENFVTGGVRTVSRQTTDHDVKLVRW